MTDRDPRHFRQMLLNRRAEIFDRVLGLEEGWRALQERETELEEDAQKMSLMSLYDQLAFRDKREIDEIDRALFKIEEGSFGRCEQCRRPIKRARLEALPEARFCLSCERRSEMRPDRPNRETEPLSCSAAPAGYEGLSDEELEELIKEALQSDSRLDTRELRVTCEEGTIFLHGVLPSEEEHQIVLRSLLDLFCFGSIVDRVEISEVPAGEEEEMPVWSGEMTDDLFEMQEKDIFFEVPDRPPAERNL